MITLLEKDSAAERAGLEVGDVIVAIDGRVVQSASDLRNRIGLRGGGSKVTLTYVRQEHEQSVGLTTEQAN